MSNVPRLVSGVRATLAFLIVMSPALAHAQVVGRACKDSTPYFEFQLATPARWFADSTLEVHPLPAVRNPANLVQFVIDTDGVPITRTFRVLKMTDSTIVAVARASLDKWAYVPAVRDGCRVRQLIQTPIGR